MTTCAEVRKSTIDIFWVGWHGSCSAPMNCEVAIVLRGGKGVGKSFFAKQFGRLFGRHFLEISNPAHLVGNFNSHLRDTVLLFADEAFYAGDKKQLPILKHLITSDTLVVEAKNIDAESAANFVHLIMASNDDHVVQATQDERRFFVLNVGAERQQQISYFNAIARDLENGGYESLLHFLTRTTTLELRIRFATCPKQPRCGNRNSKLLIAGWTRSSKWPKMDARQTMTRLSRGS